MQRKSFLKQSQGETRVSEDAAASLAAQVPVQEAGQSPWA